VADDPVSGDPVRGGASAGAESVAGDRVFKAGRSAPFDLATGSGGMHLLQRVRDEAHRFAVTYHRRLRGKSSLGSPLEAVRGLGGGLRRRLLAHFEGLQGLKAASLDDLMAVEGVGPVLARRIQDALRGASGIDG
jgi:excinuclease ABC subunit C